MKRKIIANSLLLDQVTELVAAGKEVEIPTKGNSMRPFIVGEKDSVLLAQPADIEVGNIVMAKINNAYIIHRIIKIDGENITMMGDGNIKGCEYCTLSDICAKVIRIIHKGRAIDCNSDKERRKATLWRRLKPIRRYILAIWRRTPFW